MKAAISWKKIALAGIVLAAGSAFAATKGSLELQHPTNLGGKQLASGSYTVRWGGSGDQVEVKVYQGKNMVASIPARIVTLEKPLEYDATLMRRNDDGTMSLTRINFGGKKYALEIGEVAGGSGPAGASR